jgi:hypothetical protein
MALFTLARRRSIWVPTLFGWLVLVTVVVSGLLLLGRNLYPFLAQNEPLPGAQFLVVEGWIGPSELDQTVARFKLGNYERVITTGGPVSEWGRLLGESDYANVAARYLTTHGLQADQIVAVPAPASAQDRTYLSAVKLREWLDAQGIADATIDLQSAGVHTRRSRITYRMALGPRVDIGVLSAKPFDYGPDKWWRTSTGVKTVVGEALSLVWVTCCFFPPPPGSHDELWGKSRAAAGQHQ